MAQLVQLNENLREILSVFFPNPDFVIFENTLVDYAVTAVIFVGALIVFKLFQYALVRYFKRLAEKTKTDIDDALVEIAGSLKPPFYSFVAFYIAIQFLTLHNFAEQFVSAVLVIWIVYQVIKGLQIFTNHIIKNRLLREKDATTQSAFELIRKMAVGALWGVGILMVLSNLGVNVSSLLAGVGIGGIAIAFALQNILSDLFSSFAIYFDKPFKVGDFIIIGDHMGTVEKVGIKTTRIRALQGEEIVVSNKELTSTRIQNFKKMEERRIQFGFGVVYQTTAEQLEKIPGMVREIFAEISLARLDRVHFKSFGDSSLDFEAVYYVKVPDYNAYMDVQQEINLKLFKVFEKEKIEFAYPTRTIYLNR